MSDKVTVRLSPHEKHMLTCILRGNQSDTVRGLIRREFRRVLWTKTRERGYFHAVGHGFSVRLGVKQDG